LEVLVPEAGTLSPAFTFHGAQFDFHGVLTPA
jgi:hypothetical protein